MVEEKGIIGDDIKGLDDDISDVTLILVSKDGQRFEVERSVLMQSDLIKKLTETDKEATEFPLLHVNGAIVEKVVKYMRYHYNNPAKEIEKPLKSSNMREVVDDPWDADFVDVDQSILFDMILAANYMVVRPMLDLTCAKIATMLKGKSPEEIRKCFNIVNDFTPEEEEAVRAENKWADES